MLKIILHIKKNSLITLVLVVFFTLKIQAQIVINNNGIINVNGGTSTALSTYLVLNNPPAVPITTIGATGGIMLETEFSITQYNIGAGTTAITVPYFSSASGSGVQFPLAITGISGGIVSANGNIQFSSKKAPAFATGYDNVLYMPTGVNNMNGYNPTPTFTVDNSLNAIDRFWVIDAKGYSKSPGATYSFGYVYAEGNVNGGNTASLQPNLQAMAFDQGAFTWGNYGPTGANTSSSPTGTVTGVSIGAGYMGNIFRSWTLVSRLNPLPVELLNFTGTCLNKGINLVWSTASESNSSFFTIEKSFDGQNFTWLANINAAGNSTQQKNYVYFDENSNGITYYKLSETDKNGSEKTYKIVSVNACNTNESIHVFSSNQNLNLNVYSLSNQAVSLAVYDITGRIIYKENLSAVVGGNNYTLNPQVAKGIYMVEIQTNTTTLIKRVPLIN